MTRQPVGGVAPRHAGQAALVTGAGQGIGRAICERLVDEGASVVALDIDETSLASLADGSPGQVLAHPGDVSRESDCIDAVVRCVQAFGSIDIVAAHAGIAEPRPFLDLDAEHWRRHHAINLDGAFYCLLHAARAMVDAGRSGAMIVTSSINGFHVEESMTSYNVTKGALLTLVRSAAMDLGRHGIRVNGVAPGVVDTPLAEFVVHDDDLGPRYLSTMPLGRFGRPRDVAAAVSWLASDDASYITGHTVVLDGGQSLGIPGDLSDGG